MRAARVRAAAICCLFAAAVAFILPANTTLEVPSGNNQWYGDVAISASYYVTSTPLPGNNGMVHVFTRDGTLLQSLFSREPADQFGQSLAIDGDNLFVAAPGTNVYAGAVYHFSISQKKLVNTIQSDVRQGYFGTAIAACGSSSNTLVISAPGEWPEVDDDGEPCYYCNGWGKVYMYNAQTRSFVWSVKNPHGSEGRRFGDAVDCKKGLIAVGDPSGIIPDTESYTTGFVVTFDMNANLLYTLTDESDSEWSSYDFGASVAIGDSYIAIGVPSDNRVDLYRLDAPDCRRSFYNSASGGFGVDVAASGDKFAAAFDYVYDYVGAVAIVPDLDLMVELGIDYYYGYLGSRVAILGDTVLVSESSFSGGEPTGESVTATSAAGSTNSSEFVPQGEAHHESSKSRFAKQSPTAKARRARRLASSTAVKAEYFDDDYYTTYHENDNTGFLFELVYPSGSTETISAGGEFEGVDLDGFGGAVATSHMHTVVGAPNTDPDNGVVHIFSADRQWERVLYPPHYSKEFGFSVALFSDWVLVGSPSAHPADGAAHLYSAVTGQRLYDLIPNNAEAISWGSGFGHSVAFCGDNGLAVVGVPYADSGDVNAGEVIVFRLTPLEAVEIARLQPAPVVNLEFGRSVSCIGQTILVGAPARHNGAYATAYLFQITPDGAISSVYNFRSNDAFYDFDDSEFGTSVTLAGQFAVIGAPNAYHPIVYRETGTVAVLNLGPHLNNTSGQMATLAAQDPVPWSRFGESVALSGDLLVVGAKQADGKWENTGAAYTFDVRSGVQLQKLVQNTDYGVVDDQFGASVAIGGGNILIGRNLTKYSLIDYDYGDEYGSGCEGYYDYVEAFPGGTAHFFLDMYKSTCDETSPPPPGIPSVSDITESAATIAWAPSFAACYPVTSYVVYVRPDGGSYKQAAVVQGANWATVKLEPSTQYRTKVAAVNSLGKTVFGAPSQPFTTLNTSFIQFPSNGAELTVYVTGEFEEVATSGSACVLTNYFSEPDNEFGEGSCCRYVSKDAMTVQLTAGAAVVPGVALNFTSATTAIVTEFEVQPPETPLAIVGTLNWPTIVAFCDDIVLDASSFTGVGGPVYGFEYRWQLDNFLVNGAVPEDIDMFKEMFDDLPVSTAVAVFPNGTFPAGSKMSISVTASSPAFSTSGSSNRELKVDDLPTPKISLTPSSIKASIADQVTVEVDIDYGNCFLEAVGQDFVPSFSWSITGGPGGSAESVTLQVSADTRAVTIPGFVLQDTSTTVPYSIEVSLTLQTVISTSATVDVFTYDPVAFIAGGHRAVDVSTGKAVVDASASYDPNYCTAFGSCGDFVTFGYDCSYSDGSSCCGLSASSESSTVLDLLQAVNCSPEGSEAASVPVTVQVVVTGLKTKLSASNAVQWDLRSDGADGAGNAMSVEPVLPNSFSGFVGLSSSSSSSSSSSTTWTVIRDLTSTPVATQQGETAIFDPSTWPQGEQFTLQVSGSSDARMVFYTPSPPSAGSFKVRIGGSYLAAGDSIVGLTTAISLHALDFVASTGSTGGTLAYQFTDTIEVFSSVNQTTFPITLLLNEPTSSNSLSALLLSPGDHNLRLSVRGRDNGLTSANIALAVTTPYSSTNELLELLAGVNEEELSTKSNGVGAFAAALTWAADEAVMDVCSEFEPSLAASQEKLLRVWMRGTDRAAQQVRTAIKALQDVYLLTLPGLCVSDGALALDALQQTFKVFQAIPVDELPSDACSMMTQVLSAILAVPSVSVDDMDALQVVLQFMDEVLGSYCGVSVFSYDSTSTQLDAFLTAGAMLEDVTMSSVRAPPDQPLSLGFDGMYVEVDSAAAADLSKKLSSDGTGSSFWDVSSYRVSRSSLSLTNPASEVLSDVFELNIREATLPGFRFCNKVPGVVASTNACVTKRVGSSSVSGLKHPIVFTVLADPVSIAGYHHSCQYVDTEKNAFSGRGCKVLSVVPQNVSLMGDATDDGAFDGSNSTVNSSMVAVTCACNHMTAFAVRQMALAGKTDCDDLGSGWKDTYQTPQYKAFVTLMLLAWLGLFVMLTMWLRSVAKTVKHTNASLVANVLFYPACVLRIIYFAMLLHGFGVSSNVACVEFGIAGSGSGYGQYTMPVLHDLAEPILLIAFTSIVLYWYELEKSLSGPLNKMLSAKYLSTNTLWLFITIDVLLLVILVGVNFGLLSSGNADVEDTNDAARALLVVQSVICICEAVAFIWYGWAVVKAGGGADKMRKVVKLLRVSAVMFIIMAVLQIVFASPDTVSNPRMAYGLYSVLLHIAEVVGAAVMIQALAVNRKDSRTMIGSLLQKFTSSSSGTAKWWPTSIFTSSSSGGGRKSSSAPATAVAAGGKNEKDVELVVSHYDFANDQYVSRSAKQPGNTATVTDASSVAITTGTTSVAPVSVLSDESDRTAHSSIPLHELASSADMRDSV